MIRYATIGTNFIVEWFLDAAKECENLTYTAAYSRKPETAQKLAERYGAQRICTDLKELAEAKDIDAVYIASPNSLHFEQARYMLSHGKHVLCEKPITSNLWELQCLLEIAKQNHVVIMEAMRPVYDPAFDAIKSNLPNLGKIRRASFQFCQYSSRYDKFKAGIIENAFDPSFSNGALMDLGVYCIHPLVRLFGLPTKLSSDAIILDNGIDGAGTILAGYGNMQAELMYSKISASVVPSQIQGEAASMTIRDICAPYDVKIHYKNGETETIVCKEKGNNMAFEIREWARIIESGENADLHNQYSIMEMQVMDEVRGQLGIVFPADKKKKYDDADGQAMRCAQTN